MVLRYFSRIILIVHMALCASFAEVHQCDGVWTSTSCGQGSAPSVLSSEGKESRDARAVEKSKKESVLHETRKLASSLNSYYSTEKEQVDNLASFCGREETTLSECEHAANKLRNKLKKSDSREAYTELLNRRNEKLERRETKKDEIKRKHGIKK